MSFPPHCNSCLRAGSACPHHTTDLNRPAYAFLHDGQFTNGLQEFKFLPNGDEYGWFTQGPVHKEERPLGSNFGYSDLLRSACDPARITFDVDWTVGGSSEEGSSPRLLATAEAPINRKVPSNSTISFTYSKTSIDGSSENAKRTDNAATTEAHALETTMDREARVQRYKEKRTRRTFEKQIRYASRKAYAETRPRVRGRFAKATDASMASATPTYGINHLDMGWYHQP